MARTLWGIYLSDLSLPADVLVGVGADEASARREVARRNAQALATNGGEPFRPNGTPLPVYYTFCDVEHHTPHRTNHRGTTTTRPGN